MLAPYVHMVARDATLAVIFAAGFVATLPHCVQPWHAPQLHTVAASKYEQKESHEGYEEHAGQPAQYLSHEHFSIHGAICEGVGEECVYLCMGERVGRGLCARRRRGSWCGPRSRPRRG